MTGADRDTVMIRDESDDENVTLHDIPDANEREDSPGLGEEDDKKKLRFKTTYDGFSIWGWVLCLFVERKGGPGKKSSATDGNAQALMQDWITSTQQQKEDEE